ncbi:MAG TPA: MFS transporter [Micromonosporaceae bacterium]|jgi:MFS family permease
MRNAARRYRTLLAARGVRSLLVSSLIGRLPIGMGMLLFILVVHAGTGSYTVGGLAAAANSLATAFFGPPLGRLADRGHAALILVVTGVLQAASLVGLVIALKLGSGDALIIAIGAITGIVNPPIAAVTRTVLPRLAPDEPSRMTAFALDATLIDMTYVIGPAIVGVVSAIWSGYAAALVAAAFSVIGALGVAAARSVRHGYPRATGPRRTGSRWRRLIGPLSSRGLRTVLIVSILQAAAFGVLEVAIPAYTNASGMPQAGGLLIAIWSCGSIVGGLWYGAQDFRASLGRQYAVLMTLNMIGFSSMLLAGGPYTLGIFLFFAGLFIAPATTVEGALVTRLAPADATTEAFTWSGTAIYLGFALGSGIGALALSSSLGSTSALTNATLIAVALSAVGTLLTVTERRSLRVTRLA